MIVESLVVDGASDAELCDRVKQFLAQQHFASFRQLDVIVSGDRVVLQGRVSTFHERQLAVTFCQRVPGVHGVVDRLVVPDAWAVERAADRRSPGGCRCL